MPGELNIYRFSSGLLNVTCQIYFSGAQVGAAVTLAEIGSTQNYSADFPVAITTEGVYNLIFFEGSDYVGSGEIRWDGTQEVVCCDDSSSSGGLTAEQDARLQDIEAFTAASLLAKCKEGCSCKSESECSCNK